MSKFSTTSRAMLAGTLFAASLPLHRRSLCHRCSDPELAFLGQSWNILGGYAGQFSGWRCVLWNRGLCVGHFVEHFWHRSVDRYLRRHRGRCRNSAFIGFVSFRYGLRGSYFAPMLAFAEVFRVIANSVEFTGGGVGIFIAHEPSLARLQFDDPAGFYYIALVMALISIPIAMWLGGHGLVRVDCDPRK